MNFVKVLAGHRRERRRPRRSATDAMSPLFAQLAADGVPGRGDRRRRAAPAIGPAASRRPRRSRPSAPPSMWPSAALAAAVAELRAGVTERELTGVFMEAMASRGVTTPATQDVAWHHLARASLAPSGRDVRRASRATSSRSTPASSATATSARSAAPGPSVGGATAASATAARSAGTSSGTGCSTAAGPARRRAICSMPTRPAGDAAAPGAGRPWAWASASTTRCHARACPAPRPSERLDPGMVLVVTALRLATRASARSSAHEPVAHHRRPGPRCCREPVLEPEPQEPDDVTDADVPPPEEIILYEKDPATKIATITLNRPGPAQRADDRHAAAATPTCFTRRTSTTT